MGQQWRDILLGNGIGDLAIGVFSGIGIGFADFSGRDLAEGTDRFQLQRLNKMLIRRAHALRVSIQIVCSSANPLKKISFRSTRSDSLDQISQ